MKIIEKKLKEDETMKWKDFVRTFKKFPHPKAGEFKLETFGFLNIEQKNQRLSLIGKSIQIGDSKISPDDNATVTLYTDFNYGIKINDSNKNNSVMYIFYAS